MHFLMRPVYYKYLKFWKVCRNFNDIKCMDGAGRFWKNQKKKKTLLPKLSMPVIWARYDLQLNYLIGRNFDIHPPTFSIDGCFPLYYPLFYALGSFSSQNFCRFNPTLAGPILDQAGPSRILLNWSDSPASVVRVMAQPAPGQLRVWQKKKKSNTTNDRERSTGFK